MSESPVPRPRALALVRDLLLRSRISAAAAAIGAEVSFASTLAAGEKSCGELGPAMIFADLSDPAFPSLESAEKLRAAAPNARLVAFASHVDLKSLKAAREAGFDLTLSRSEFTARLPELLHS